MKEVAFSVGEGGVRENCCGIPVYVSHGPFPKHTARGQVAGWNGDGEAVRSRGAWYTVLGRLDLILKVMGTTE